MAGYVWQTDTYVQLLEDVGWWWSYFIKDFCYRFSTNIVTSAGTRWQLVDVVFSLQQHWIRTISLRDIRRICIARTEAYRCSVKWNWLQVVTQVKYNYALRSSGTSYSLVVCLPFGGLYTMVAMSSSINILSDDEKSTFWIIQHFLYHLTPLSDFYYHMLRLQIFNSYYRQWSGGYFVLCLRYVGKYAIIVPWRPQ